MKAMEAKGIQSVVAQRNKRLSSYLPSNKTIELYDRIVIVPNSIIEPYISLSLLVFPVKRYSSSNSPQEAEASHSDFVVLT